MAGDTLEASIEGLTDELFDFYRAHPLDRAEAGMAGLQWSFEDTRKPFAVMRRNGKIVGLSAYIGTRFKLGAATGSAFQAVDSFVSDEMRGRGIFARLARCYADYALEQGADVLWGFPNPNAAPIWFGRLGWTGHGQIPLLVRPLRAGWALRRLGLGGDFRTISAQDRNLQPLPEAGPWLDALWDRYAQGIGCAVLRDAAFIRHRLFQSPHAPHYRVVGVPDDKGCLVATRAMAKHGGRIAYLLEAMGGADLGGALRSELGRLCDQGVELVLAWSYPWSPNYRALRASGFMPIPAAVRPAHIWFGSQACSPAGEVTVDRRNWYLSYLDSDTI